MILTWPHSDSTRATHAQPERGREHGSAEQQESDGLGGEREALEGLEVVGGVGVGLEEGDEVGDGDEEAEGDLLRGAAVEVDHQRAHQQLPPHLHTHPTLHTPRVCASARRRVEGEEGRGGGAELWELAPPGFHLHAPPPRQLLPARASPSHPVKRRKRADKSGEREREAGPCRSRRGSRCGRWHRAPPRSR
eukprot:396964-Rhodomonas_salina.1